MILELIVFFNKLIDFPAGSYIQFHEKKVEALEKRMKEIEERTK